MPTGTLRFKLPEEGADFDLAQHASALSSVISDVDNKLRAMSKYQDIKSISIEEARKLIWDAVRDYELERFF